MPWPPWSDMSWHYRAWIDLLRNPARLPPIILTLVIIVLGWISLLYRRWQLAMIFMVSFLTVLIVSSFRDYPFGDRLMLFSLPLIFLLLAEGIERIRLFFMRVSMWPAVFSCILFTTLFWSHPLYTAYSNVLRPKMGEDIKPVMAYMRDNRLGSDSIYIYHGAQPAFQYDSYDMGLPRRTMLWVSNPGMTRQNIFRILTSCRVKTATGLFFLIIALNALWMKAFCLALPQQDRDKER